MAVQDQAIVNHRCLELIVHIATETKEDRHAVVAVGLPEYRVRKDRSMAVHMVLLAVPAVAGGFLQAFQFSFLLWPFNLALPLARDLPHACITLWGIASFYAAGLQGYVSGARRRVQLLLLQARSQQQDSSSPRGMLRTREDAVAHAMIAFNDIY